jgi:hypothetical protein
MFIYIIAFVLAEAAFMTMAIKEYLQDLLGISERDLIYETLSTADKDATLSESLPENTSP